jgi:rhodanese-related sulfurtransferase
MNRAHLALALVASLAVGACATAPPPAAAPAPPPPSPTASPTASPSTPTPASPARADTVPGAKARELVKAGAKLLDVRTPAEFAARHLDGAVNVPVDDVVAKGDVGPKDATYVVYCQHGRRAARAVEALRSRGYANVVSVGGIDDWDR